MSAEPIAGEVTRVLIAARQGDGRAVERLMPLIYDELRLVARQRLRRRRPGQTFDTVALVNETYLKLVDVTHAEWEDRSHFLAVASVAMRNILVDHARRRRSQKRGGDDRPLTLDERRLGSSARTDSQALDILALDAALTELAGLDDRLAKLVELRFFGGLSVQETASALGISDRTVKRGWRKARAFLFRALNDPTS